MRIFSIYVILLLLFPNPMEAQTPYFKVHSIEETYKGIKVEKIYSDHNSLIWFGTSQGLFLYDGITFNPFNKPDASSNYVTSIYQDHLEKIWVGYQDGSIYYLDKQHLVEWQPEEGTPSVAITGFTEDLQNRFWFATYGEGVYLMDEGRMYNFGVEDGLPGADIYVMKADQEGNIWLGTDGGISICQFKDKEKKVKNITKEDGLPDDIVKEILPDAKGNFWIGYYDNGFSHYNFATRRFRHYNQSWDHGIINCMELFEERELWIGTAGNGVWRLDLDNLNGTPKWVSNELQRAKVTDLQKDIEGNIWVTNNKNGICSANRQFEFLYTNHQNIQAVLKNSSDQLWIGSQEGLFKLQTDRPDTQVFVQHLAELDLNVISLYEDKYSNLWIGTFGQGLYIYDPEKKRIEHLSEKHGLTNGSILSMDGVNGHVWIATLGGVTEFEYKSNIFNNPNPDYRNFNQADGLGTNFIFKVFIDSKGRTWFGTDGKGISVLENNEIKNYSEVSHYHSDSQYPENIKLRSVYSIAEDSEGNIWLSTAKKGIFKFDGERFHHLTLKEGIRDLEITSLISDIKGNILIVHSSGLDLLDPRSHHLIYYDDAVGVKDINPNLNAFCKDQHGNIWIADQKNIIEYTPLYEDLEIHPRTLLNGVSVFLEPIDFHTENRFNYKDNNLIFDYVGVWYTDPATVKYKYILEGYDLDWIYSKDHRATYSNLPSGDYVFRVTSTENDAFAHEPIVEYQFTILTPIWKQLWFILFCICCLLGLVYWYIKIRDKRIQRLSLLEKENAQSQLAALKAQINPHFLFNSFNTLVTLIDEDAEGAIVYVEKLADFYRSMMQYRDKEVISLKEELKLVQDYSYLLQKRFGENFKLDILINGEPVYVAPLTLQTLIENAVKHNIISKSKPLSIKIEMNGDDYIAVSNNLQKKSWPEKSTRFGLQSLTRRYELLSNKKIKIEESKTIFKVSIPIIKS